MSLIQTLPDDLRVKEAETYYSNVLDKCTRRQGHSRRYKLQRRLSTWPPIGTLPLLTQTLCPVA